MSVNPTSQLEALFEVLIDALDMQYASANDATPTAWLTTRRSRQSFPRFSRFLFFFTELRRRWLYRRFPSGLRVAAKVTHRTGMN
ncbi:hypothetical protein ACSFBF_32850 [Variovorax sp. ZT5P49]|uniref:hypothetical protein n=1 Tax=Variovorax sp. ZT5P49 TaxID=3443733 RepID=UPI003F44DE85